MWPLQVPISAEVIKPAGAKCGWNTIQHTVITVEPSDFLVPITCLPLILSFLQPSLGVSRAGKAMIFVIIGPVGPYFATGSFNPVSLMADPSYVRAWKGGVGAYKMGG